jgi:type I restriction enzyme S subunit
VSETRRAATATLPFQSFFREKPRNGIYKGPAFIGSGSKLVRMGDLFTFDRVRSDWTGYQLINLSESELSRHSLQRFDLLFCRTSVAAQGVGKCSIVEQCNEGLVAASNLIRIRLDTNRADSLFFYYFFSSAFGSDLVRSKTRGAAVFTITGGDIGLVEVPDWPLPVQRKIAAVVSAYDDLIENNNRRIKVLEEMARRIYREWFVDFRYPGHEGVSLVDSDLGPIPADWKVCRLGEVCARITDGAHRSPATTDEGMPMASVKDMTPRDLDEEGARRISADDYELVVRQESRPRAGDILISKDGANFLKHVFPLFRDGTAVLLSSVAILTPNDSVSPLVLTLSLRDPENKSRLKGFVSGAAIPRIVLKDFKQHKLVLPPQDLQMLFDSRFGGTLSQSALLSSANRKLREARNLLLPRLMSGEIDVSDLHITFAEAAA